LVISTDNKIISGHRRFNACKKLGITKVRCRYTYNNNETLELITLNKYRVKSKKEIDAEWKLLKEQRGKEVSRGNPNIMREDKTSNITKRELHSSTFNVSPATSQKMMFIEKWEPDLYQKVLDNLISTDGAYKECKKLHPTAKEGKKQKYDVFKMMDDLGVSEVKGKRGAHTHPKTSFDKEFEMLWRKYFKGKGGMPIDDFVSIFKKMYPITHTNYLKEEHHN
jgi:hypothetical protein